MIAHRRRHADKGDWSSGMIPASGAGGHEFDSRITPCFFADTGRGRLAFRVDVQGRLAFKFGFEVQLGSAS
jgi:hypothetical protein